MGRTQLKYLPRRRTRKHEQEQAAKHEQEAATHERQKMKHERRKRNHQRLQKMHARKEEEAPTRIKRTVNANEENEREEDGARQTTHSKAKKK